MHVLGLATSVHVGTAALGCPAAQMYRATNFPLSSNRSHLHCHPEEGAFCPTKDPYLTNAARRFFAL